MSPSTATITMPPAIRPQPGAPGGPQPLRRDEDREREQDEGHDRQDDAEQAQLLGAVGDLRQPLAGRALPDRDLARGVVDALGQLGADHRDRRRRLVHGVLQLDHALGGVLGEQPLVQAVDRPAEDVPEAVARDDPAHHGPHERLGPLGLGAAAGDQLGGQGVGEEVLDVGRGERRLRPVAKLARVEQLAAHIEHDRPEDDRHDRQAEQDAGADPAPARARRGRVTGSARRSWLRHQLSLGRVRRRRRSSRRRRARPPLPSPAAAHPS